MWYIKLGKEILTMAKLKNPLLSLSAQGRLGKAISFVKRGGRNLVERKPEVPDAKTLAQLSWRHMFLKVVALWHALSPAEKLQWESVARPHHMTGYAYFISQSLRPNPGIYLPLQGGTMSGDIDMAKNRILRLPAPVDAQEAANREWVLAQIPAAAPKAPIFSSPAWATTWSGSGQRHSGASITLATHYCGIEFDVPDDFTSVDSVTVIRAALATGTHRLTYYSGYGSVGESGEIHLDQLLNQDTVEVDNILYEQDVSGILGVIVAGDIVSVQVWGCPVNVPKDNILGLRFKYS